MLNTKDARGSTNSIFVLLLAPALLLLVGLSIDGGRQLTAIQRAEAAADTAARAGLNAASGATITGDNAARHAALTRAQTVLTQSGVTGTITFTGQTMTVETTATEPTQYLSMIGITTMTGRAVSTVTITDADR